MNLTDRINAVEKRKEYILKAVNGIVNSGKNIVGVILAGIRIITLFVAEGLLDKYNKQLKALVAEKTKQDNRVDREEEDELIG